jgi:hypothetical protein
MTTSSADRKPTRHTGGNPRHLYGYPDSWLSRREQPDPQQHILATLERIERMLAHVSERLS